MGVCRISRDTRSDRLKPTLRDFLGAAQRPEGSALGSDAILPSRVGHLLPLRDEYPAAHRTNQARLRWENTRRRSDDALRFPECPGSSVRIERWTSNPM